MEELKVTVTMTKAQVAELERFSRYLIEDYKSGFYDLAINCCLRDGTNFYLMCSACASAFRWFLSKNVPFACVYEFIEAFVEYVMQERRYLYSYGGEL